MTAPTRKELAARVTSLEDEVATLTSRLDAHTAAPHPPTRVIQPPSFTTRVTEVVDRILHPFT